MEFPGIILDIPAISQSRKPDNNSIYDMLIVGGGPSAMSAAIYGARKMINLALITLDFGGQVKETSVIENYLGVQSINAQELVAKFEEHVKSFDIPINLGVSIVEIKKKDDIFTVYMEDGTNFLGHTIIFATGERHRQLNVPGEKELLGKGVTYCATCDAPLFKGKKVIVVGGGNSAFTTAFDLLKLDAEIILVNYASGWQADEIFLKPVKNLVELTKQGEVIVDCFCRTSIPGFFAAGDVTTVPHKQIIISAGEGAKAALSAYDNLIKSYPI